MSARSKTNDGLSCLRSLRDKCELAPNDKQRNDELYLAGKIFYSEWCIHQNPAGAVAAAWRTEKTDSGNPAFRTRVAELLADNKDYNDALADLGSPDGLSHQAVIEIVCRNTSHVKFGLRFQKERGRAALFALGVLRPGLEALRTFYRRRGRHQEKQ